MQQPDMTLTGDMPVENLRQWLAHVRWIGGATDSGKTSIAGILVDRYGWQVYHYDRTDLAHHERLAESRRNYRTFLRASLDERWVQPAPETLLQRALESFRDRWPLVVADLLALPRDRPLLAEGFGLMPELVAPVLLSSQQAVWLVPTEHFKRASMERRNKPAWREETSDPDRARENVFQRDMLLAAAVRSQAEAHRLTVYEVDGSQTALELAEVVERHFAPFLLGSG